MQAALPPPSSIPHWDARSTATLPQRFQQRANTSPLQNQVIFPSESNPMAPISEQTPPQPPINHTRSSSFFSFRKDKQPAESPALSHRRTLSKTNGNSPDPRQFTQNQLRRSEPSSPMASPPLPQASGQFGQQLQPQLPGVQPNPSGPTSPTTQSTTSQQPPGPPPLHPEIRSVVQLTAAHAHKIYFSGPLVRRIERQPDGQRPTRDEGWADVWAQLGGTTLSIWDMKEIQEASKLGKEVPPTYVNVTDAFVQVLGSVTAPASGTAPPKRYTNVITLNTAGSNLLLFSCPSTPALLSWAAALRLAAWEKSRLEEIYTAHLIRITLNDRAIPTTLVRGRMEGWVRIRIAGQTDWKRVWAVVTASADGSKQEEKPQEPAGGIGAVPTPPAAPKKKRMSNLFSRDNSPPHLNAPVKSMISIYTSPKPKDRKKALLTMQSITQVFAVYPERPELISRSTLIKVEGLLGDEEITLTMKNREGWLLIMPELENGVGQAAEMLKWVVALHDAFHLYGRPDGWTWDPRDPVSLMFAYPVGPHKDLLFLDREAVETLDPRDDRTSAIRSQLLSLLVERNHGNNRPTVQAIQQRPGSSQRNSVDDSSPPSLPPIASVSTPGPAPTSSSFQLPPLSFSETSPREKHQLSPINEASSTAHGNSLSRDTSTVLTGRIMATGPLAENSNDKSLPIKEVDLMSSDDSASTTLTPKTTPTNLSQPAENTAINQNIGTSGIRTTSSSIDKDFGNKSSSFSSPLPLEPVHSKLVGKTSPSLGGISADNASPIIRSYTSQSSTDKASILTSPHSIANEPSFVGSDYDHYPLTSPHSPISDGHSPLPASLSSVLNTSSQSNTPTRSVEVSGFEKEAGALFYMQQHTNLAGDGQPRRIPPAVEEQDETSSSSSDSSIRQSSVFPNPHSIPSAQPLADDLSGASRSPPVRRATPMAFTENLSPSTNSYKSGVSNPVDRLSPQRPGLGRKPSGARAPAGRSYSGDAAHSSQPTTEEGSQSEDSMSANVPGKAVTPQANRSPSMDESNEDILHVLSYLDVKDDQPPLSSQKPEHPEVRKSELIATSSPPPQPHKSSDAVGVQYKSSFAPSKQAAERKAKVQAQQAAHHAAVHKPGRASGKRKSRIGGTWNESSEEEEEEDDDDDEVDSDGEPSAAHKMQNMPSASNGSRPPQNPNTSAIPAEHPVDIRSTSPHNRPPRTLPQIPGSRGPHDDTQPRRMISDQYSESARRTYYDDGPHIRSQAEFPRPGAARQTVWSQVLDPGRGGSALPDSSQGRDTFVQLEPSEAMTKAFTPQGLLSAGLQDKEDRSAKRQEELARESGASLINVPNKPPPPQTGLLGAITAHERERKRDGGVGAALTEREREKRLAEERQRRFDEQQRQQLEQMQQGGSMYGVPYAGYNSMMANPMMMGMNPMMLNPMMTGGGMAPMMSGNGMAPMMTGNGMNPMMTGPGMNPMMTGQMGHPGMMGFNPQHMFAAQQAAQAYQQAMMAFSVAGSQAGGENGGPSQLNPTATGGNMGFDPRMSMMGMPMMGGMGMQMTGMSGFDSRFSPGGMNSGLPGGIQEGHPMTTNQMQGQFVSSNASSPVGQGSPATRGPDQPDITRSSRPTSPKP